MNEILNINNVHGYLDKETGTAYLNAGDVARGFGFTKTETKNGVKYESVRWARVNEYLSSFGFRPNVVEDDFLPENMVYRLGFKASNEVAQRFQAVLADEVIPAIRKHGAYMTEDALKKAITEPDFLIKLATNLKEEKEKRLAAERQIEADRPKVTFANAVNVSKDGMLIGMLAKILHQNGVDTGQKRLFQWMREKGYLMKSGADKNMPTQKAREMGLFKVKERAIDNPDGSVRLTRTTLVTGKGQQYFINKLLAPQREYANKHWGD
ncbi:MAG: phage antirepressor KilAC domain-containing protein [Succiniclasticum sp.]|nr:phage antirepressor KilAC domain-containing protein [Succiniclasticum sp.]